MHDLTITRKFQRGGMNSQVIIGKENEDFKSSKEPENLTAVVSRLNSLSAMRRKEDFAKTKIRAIGMANAHVGNFTRFSTSGINPFILRTCAGGVKLARKDSQEVNLCCTYNVPFIRM